MVSELASQIVAVAGGTAPPLVVFDFDHTVLRIHSYAKRLAAADVAERDVERDAADLPFFRAFLGALVRPAANAEAAGGRRRGAAPRGLGRRFESSPCPLAPAPRRRQRRARSSGRWCASRPSRATT